MVSRKDRRERERRKSGDGGQSQASRWKKMSALISKNTFHFFRFMSFPTGIANGNPDAKRLYDDLISRYNKLVRPVRNVSDPLTVHIKLKLSQLIEVASWFPLPSFFPFTAIFPALLYSTQASRSPFLSDLFLIQSTQYPFPIPVSCSSSNIWIE